MCDVCGNLKSKTGPHVCGEDEKWCSNCKISVDYEHRCFIKKADTKKNITKRFAGFIWFDIEAFMNEDGFHEANLIMAKRMCKECLSSSQKCDICLEKYSFVNIQEFVSWCLKDYNKHFTFISHNGKSYDNYFVMRYLQKNKTIKDPNLRAITDGQKGLSFEFRTLIFKDSSLFITRPLESFTKTFNLKELKKGFFPHEFNRRKNFNYVGKYPAQSYYKPEYFSNDKKIKFEEWYESVKDCEFDFQKELREYCWSDVELLSEGCLQFSRLNREGSKLDDKDDGIDPFQNNLTTSSFCNTLYRRNFMAKDSIAWIPANGFNPKENTSKKADLWLKYISKNIKGLIQHAKNGGEKKIGPYKVDGFCPETKQIFEFQGCLFHGCEVCNGPNSFNPVLQVMNSTLRLRTEKKINFLKKTFPDFEIIEMWEHVWDKKCKDDEDLFTFVKDSSFFGRLNIRDALYGGRTNALVLYHLCKKDEKIGYIDFTSLYPAVQKYGVYPIGHPKIITENFDYKKKYFGIIKCTILPPQNLYIPVLPLNINNKLIFTLCYKCALEQTNELNCKHSEIDRALEGTWVSLELDKALEMGYKLIKYHEIYEFSEKISYDPIKKSGGLFTDYVNHNLKEKQEASGFPAYCTTDALKDKYIQDYYDNEGVKLDKANIEKNSGKREIAKIKLNCLWGYFALNSNKKQFKIITKRNELEDLINDDRYDVHNIDFSDENFIQVTFSEKKEYCYGGHYTNVIIASFVTAQARLKLYDELIKLGIRVLYFDTDSIIFVYKDGDYVPKLGDFLGEFTNEIDPRDGVYIIEFVSGGPKNYAVKFNTGKTDCTVKGYPINYLTNLLLNFDSIKACVDNSDMEIKIPQLKFIKDKSQWLIKTEIHEKRYNCLSYNKRLVLPNGNTLPYGYISI